MGGIVGYFDSRKLKSGQAKNFVQNCLSVGMVYPNSSSYKNDHYVGSMVGRNAKDSGYMENIGYYCSDIGIKAFGTKSSKGIDDSNGTAYSRTLSEILTSSFVGDWSTWCEYKVFQDLNNSNLERALSAGTYVPAEIVHNITIQVPYIPCLFCPHKCAGGKRLSEKTIPS